MVQVAEKIKPGSHTEEVVLANGIKVEKGSQLHNDKNKDMVKVLQENNSIFAEASNTVLGIERSIIKHHLEVDPKVKPVCQKMCQLTSEKKR